MSQELLAILEQMEREKGIKKEVLIEAVEAALLIAARKVVDVKPEEELTVQLDRDTGKIRAFKNKQEITSIDFGRIAASTARQVIIQKIREAEKEVVFNDFQGKVGEIVSGTVYRFEKGNIVVDLLGKAEGIILKHEQSPKEEFKQGQRIRAYVLEVRRDNRGAQIILSRTHPNLVKKLFELEVPEIYEGIVEIKSIARQAGERTKIAVLSKNDKVDSVGACVGMRGNRVRNIVNELYGEKIDIVRYSDDIKQYITAALSPAKINEIRIDKDSLKAQVIVDDDQLSLAIGKHGQNVRLASRLIGWELDIRTKAALAAEAEQKEEEEKKEAKKEKEEKKQKKEMKAGVKTKAKKTKAKAKVKTKAKTKLKVEAGPVALKELSGVGGKMLLNLKQAGFHTPEDVAKAGIEDLAKIKGIGQKKAQKLIEQAKKLKS